MTTGVEAVVLQASVGTFAFSCLYAAAPHSTKHMSELLATQALTVGAAVFNLQGRVVGVLSACGKSYDVKFANKAGYLSDRSAWSIPQYCSAMYHVNLCCAIL